MATGDIRLEPAHRVSRIHLIIGLSLFFAIAALGLTWAKWDPYGHKVAKILDSRAWSGSSILSSAGEPAAAPSWHGAWTFTVTYGKAVWIALVAALLISAAVEALVPQRWLVRVLSGHGRVGGSVVGGLLALPCMMCTCCTAPVASTLRRRGAPLGSVLGYWLGNPILNPAVLVFLALVAPWQWTVTRLVVGAALVFGVTAVVARATERRAPSAGTALVNAGGWAAEPAVDELRYDLREAPVRFARTLARLSLFLIPEYFVVVFALGAFRGWLFPLGGSAARWGLLAVVVAAVAGTLVVIPTAGEIPIMQGLALLGLGAGPLGALLVTLPAISLPSMAMVGRALSWRVTSAMAGAVMLTGLVSAGTLAALS